MFTGNLGDYQIMTTMAKRVGGPKALAVLFLGAGYIGFRSVEGGIRKIVAINKSSYDSEEVDYLIEGLRVATTSTDNQGLTLKNGDVVNILEFADDGVLIEVVGNDNNPYFVSKEFLEKCIEEVVIVTGDKEAENVQDV